MADKRTAASGSRKRKKKKKKKSGLRPFGLFLVILILFVAAGAGMVYYRYRQDLKTDRSPIVMVDGTDISGMTEEQAFNAIISKYPWSIKVVYDGGEKPIDDLLTPVVMEAVRSAQEEENALIEQERQVDFKTRLSRLSQGAEKATITRDLQALENTEFLAAEVAGELGSELGEPAVSGVMLSYDATSGQFQYADSKAGREVDTYQLSSDIRQALDDGDYTAVIEVKINTVQPEVSREQYKKIGSYTTHTTANESRNTNVRLAAQAINGMVIQPGERFSFNETVGKRTPEKGYKEAGAYADGVTVQEYGGGVCQISSTLYNAVISAGLETVERTGHTFEPTYVTPGQDATVSYAKPDFAFVNNSPYPIGILASFANRTVVVDLYGVPILEEGEKRYLVSERSSDAPGGGYEYVEDPTMPFGSEEIIKAEGPGSVWKTDIVTEKDGKVVQREYLHSTRYKGHAGTIRRNTTNPAVPALPEAAPAPAPAPEPAPQSAEQTAEQPAGQAEGQ